MHFIFLGIEDKTGNAVHDPSKFSYVSPDVNGATEITNLKRGEFPWGSDQPNDDFWSQHCIE